MDLSKSNDDAAAAAPPWIAKIIADGDASDAAEQVWCAWVRALTITVATMQKGFAASDVICNVIMVVS